MLDIKQILEDFPRFEAAMKSRREKSDLSPLAGLNARRLELISRAETAKARRNAESGRVAVLKREKKEEEAKLVIAEMAALGEEIKTCDKELAEVMEELNARLMALPNFPHESVPEGADETENSVLRSLGQPPAFAFDARPHWDIGQTLGILDFPAAAKISGSRFVVYRGAGARLERALIQFMLDVHTGRGYTEILPPYLVNRASMTGTGQLPKFEEDAFSTGEDMFLIPTAEVPVTNLLRDEIVEADALPIKYCAYSACFRAEAGSAGRDTRGLVRLHQFNKVELVQFVAPEEGMQALESLTTDAEEILKQLGLAYRVSQLCTGDLGFSSAKTYDLEVWLPSYNRYVEISSCSCFTDFQARRANIKYRPAPGAKPRLVYTLNGSGLAIGRTLAAILENYQNEDGSVTVPPALVPYMKTDRITAL